MADEEQKTPEEKPEENGKNGEGQDSQDTKNIGFTPNGESEEAGITMVYSPEERGEILKRDEERRRQEEMERRAAEAAARAEGLSRIDRKGEIDANYLEQIQLGDLRYTADGRALPKGKDVAWDLKKDERDIFLRTVIKTSGNDYIDEKVRAMINDRNPRSIVDKVGGLKLNNEPLIEADYTGMSSFVRDSENKLTRVKLPKGNSGRIVILDRAGAPYEHITTSGEATLFLGRVSDEDLDFAPLWIEERALEIFNEDRNPFSYLTKEEGFKKFTEDRERARQELESLVEKVGLRGDVLQAEIQKLVRSAHLLTPKEKLFPNSRCVVRLLLDSVNDKERRILRLRDLAIRRLHRPRLIRTVYCGETTGDRAGFRQVDIMEYWEHVSWEKLCHMFGLEDLVGIAFIEPLEELKYLNEAFGIVHRDLKPANLMINAQGQVKIGDFGVAKTDTREATKTAGFGIGSAPYMSPEQRVGKPATGRSDIYCLGITLYDIMRGEQTFTGKTQEEILNARDMGAKPLAPTKCPDFYAGLDSLGFFARRARKKLVEDLEKFLILVLQEEPENRLGYSEAIEAAKEVIGGRSPKIYDETLSRFKQEGKYYEKKVFDSHTKRTNIVQVPLWEPRNLKREAFSDTETVVVGKSYKSQNGGRTKIE